MSEELTLDGRTAIPDDDYRRSIETALDLLGTGVVYTRAGTLIHANDALFRILGYPRAQLELTDTIALAERDEQDALRALLASRLAGSQEPAVFDVRIRRGNGDQATLHVALTPLPGVGDALTLVTDVTRERSLAQAAEQRHRMDAIGHLATGVGHDFNNYLTVIRLIAEELRHADPGDRDALLDELETTANAAAQVTDQLMTFAGATGQPRVVLDVNVVVFEVAALLRRLIGTEVELALNLEPGLPPTQIDPGQLHQVLINLVVNARQAMPGGGRITIQTATRDGQVELTVADDGEGMPATVLERACEPFFTTRPELGSGMGLAIVFGITRRCGGTLQIDSRVGEGTLVRVTLPQASEATTRRPGRPAALQPTTPLHVLVAEVDVRIAGLLQNGLERMGFRVTVSEDEAAARAEPFDAVVLGVDPRGNPAEILDAHRGYAPAGRFVLLGAPSDFLIGEADVGRLAIVNKPYSLSDVASALRGEY